MLARRDYSEIALCRKLEAKGFSLDECQSVIHQLVQEGLLSNSRFIENLIHFKKMKGYGPICIRMELMEHDISEEIIESHLNITDNAWLIHARNVWQKRFKGYLPNDFKTRAQQMRFLQYRGFTREQIETIFQRYDD